MGAINGLTQTLFKLTCPGAPDVYQGQEMWDFSLVDPDNRRPVDFSLRSQALGHLQRQAESADLKHLCRDLLANYHDGRIKLWLTSRALNFRRTHKELFQHGSYVPLQASHGKEDHVVAFARLHEGQAAIVAAPRLSYTLMKGKEEPPVGSVWGDAQISMPQQVVGKQLRNVLTGEVLTAGSAMLCRELFGHFPVALLGLR